MAPSVLSPWFLVQRARDRVFHALQQSDEGIEYYVSPDIADKVDFTIDKKKAMLFQTLQSAVRIAEAANAEVRVLYNKEHFKEFGR